MTIVLGIGVFGARLPLSSSLLIAQKSSAVVDERRCVDHYCRVVSEGQGALQIRDVYKTYRITSSPFQRVASLFGLGRPSKQVNALSGVSFEIRSGEAVGIIGRNGSGKSTLLKILSGLGTPSRGAVVVRGRVQALLELGTGFHPEFSGRENLYYSAMLMGFSKREVQGLLDGIIDFAELREVIDQPLRTYSSGMKTRLAFSVATALRPDVLLLDEVLAVGDAFFQMRCFERMQKFVEGGGTLLLVSHDLSSILRTCPRTIWIDRGKVIEDGESTTVVRSYRASIVAQEEQRLQQAASKERQASANFILQRLKGSKEAEVLDVEFRGRDGKERLVFRTGEVLEAVVRFRVSVDLPRISVGLTIYRTDGVVATQPISSLDGLPDRAYAPGEYRASVCFDPLLLGPGEYVVSTALLPAVDPRDRGALSIYDVRDQADVLAIERDPEHAIERGIVHHPVRWSVEDAAGPVGPVPE